ncbi:MAG: DUF2780 domain-containing protein [Dehalogenimonas sp.]
MELVDVLICKLEVTEAQAKGGAGLILKRAKDALGDKEFAGISSMAPDLITLVRDLPATDNTVMGEVEKMFSIFGRKMGSLGSAASVRTGFLKLGLHAEMIEKFERIIVDFVKGKSGDTAGMSLEKALSD